VGTRATREIKGGRCNAQQKVSSLSLSLSLPRGKAANSLRVWPAPRKLHQVHARNVPITPRVAYRRPVADHARVGGHLGFVDVAPRLVEGHLAELLQNAQEPSDI